jgi:hypothetical protein
MREKQVLPSRTACVQVKMPDAAITAAAPMAGSDKYIRCSNCLLQAPAAVLALTLGTLL